MTMDETRPLAADPSSRPDGVIESFVEDGRGSDVVAAGPVEITQPVEEIVEERYEEYIPVDDASVPRQDEHASVRDSAKAQRHALGVGAFRCPPKYACLGCRGLLTEAQRDRHKMLGCDKDKDLKNPDFADLPPKHNGSFCSECLAFYPTIRMLCMHHEHEHGLDCPVEEVLVKSEAEFDQFYKWIQSEGGIKFIGTKARTSRDGSRVYRFFQCILVGRGTKPAEELAKRGIKGRPLLSCTAYVRRIPQDDGTFIVEYCSVHSHGFPLNEPAAFFNAEKFVRRRRKRSPGSVTVKRSLSPNTASPSTQRTNANATGTWHSPRARKRSAAMQRAIDDNYYNGVDVSYVGEEEDISERHTPPDIKPPPMLKLQPTLSNEEESPARKKGRPRARYVGNSSRSVNDSLISPIDAAKKSLEVIFQKLSTLPPEMTQQFVPILEDLASDATDAHDKFEELKNFVPRRSLARFRNQR
ncbi:hypothetical protein OESDEN_09971 [Oesophagostomum dentatum]|uniref:Uncharacterized protein n=1 Tax=Oesophagostomum dentatum TaxID=61180 RepID=A0A0B1SZ04_OESDE|nr:hypothetical protein OESDEN_09971 [Oesophagostomum dentatum]